MTTIGDVLCTWVSWLHCVLVACHWEAVAGTPTSAAPIDSDRFLPSQWEGRKRSALVVVWVRLVCVCASPWPGPGVPPPWTGWRTGQAVPALPALCVALLCFLPAAVCVCPVSPSPFFGVAPLLVGCVRGRGSLEPRPFAHLTGRHFEPWFVAVGCVSPGRWAVGYPRGGGPNHFIPPPRWRGIVVGLSPPWGLTAHRPGQGAWLIPLGMGQALWKGRASLALGDWRVLTLEVSTAWRCWWVAARLSGLAR